MESLFVYSATGLIHLIAGIVSLVTGTVVLSLKKGTALHIRWGYIYVVSMLILNVTAFMIYRLFDGFGVFHIAALISTGSLLAGMLPPLFYRKSSNWLQWHYTAMYWSVIGLYGAFVAEIAVRFLSSGFFILVGVGVGLVMLIGGLAFGVKKYKWKRMVINIKTRSKTIK